MPYIYSLAGDVCLNHGTMMRSLLFDYAADPQARNMDQEFMFGKSLLICPVTEPMYYGKENQKLEAEKVWTCYLPAGDDWYHYWTDWKYEGGQFVTVDAPLDEMPVFVKAGSIIPMKKGLTYADEKMKIRWRSMYIRGRTGRLHCTRMKGITTITRTEGMR